MREETTGLSCPHLALLFEVQEHFPHFIHHLSMRDALAIGEFAAGDLDVSGEVDAVEMRLALRNEILMLFVFGNVHDNRRCTTVLRDEQGPMCSLGPFKAVAQCPAVFRKRDDIVLT